MSRGRLARSVFIPMFERPRLLVLASCRTAPFEEVRRARCAPAPAGGWGLGYGASRGLVCALFASGRGVGRRPTSGIAQGPPARHITAEMRCGLIQLACDEPDKLLTPFRNNCARKALATALKLRAKVDVSRSAVQRTLNVIGLKPKRVSFARSPDGCQRWWELEVPG